MATRYLKFTGKRTGLTEISVLGKGHFAKGDIAEIEDDAEAERWLTAHGTAEGKSASDWVEASETEVKRHTKAVEKADAEAEEAPAEAATVDAAPPAPESANSAKE